MDPMDRMGGLVSFLEKARTEKKAVEAVKKILRQEHSPEATCGASLVAVFWAGEGEGRKAGRVKPFFFAVGNPVSYNIKIPTSSHKAESSILP